MRGGELCSSLCSDSTVSERERRIANSFAGHMLSKRTPLSPPSALITDAVRDFRERDSAVAPTRVANRKRWCGCAKGRYAPGCRHMPSRCRPTIRRPTPPAGTRGMRGRAFADGNFRPVRITLVRPGVRANVRRAPSAPFAPRISVALCLSLPPSLGQTAARTKEERRAEPIARSGRCGLPVLLTLCACRAGSSRACSLTSPCGCACT
jgi:hypothetical protein